mgnify:CR=1 FL=1
MPKQSPKVGVVGRMRVRVPCDLTIGYSLSGIKHNQPLSTDQVDIAECAMMQLQMLVADVERHIELTR